MLNTLAKLLDNIFFEDLFSINLDLNANFEKYILIS